MRYFLLLIVPMCSYYFFSYEFFMFLSEMKHKKISFFSSFLCFAIVYTWFFGVSILEFPLILNWFVFMIILGIEVYKVFSFDFLTSYALSMFCIITGLASNIVLRSFFSIIMDIPLNQFDNTLNSFKVYPIVFGFLFMGLLFLFLRHIAFSEKIKIMIENRKSLHFYFWLEFSVFAFLIIQLLIYSQMKGLIGVKMWGVKAGLFSIVILLIAQNYTLRVASLNQYMEKQHYISNQLIEEKEDINKLWKLAYVDMLTGCYNRQLLEKRLEEYASYGGKITLAFIDLNGLKAINDRSGHLEGDIYIKRTVELILDVFQNFKADLFRYGGDEFILLSYSLSTETMSQLLEKVNEIIQKDNSELYQRSISYGVVQGYSDCYKELIESADQKMYQCKMKYYESRAL